MPMMNFMPPVRVHGDELRCWRRRAQPAFPADEPANPQAGASATAAPPAAEAADVDPLQAFHAP